MTLRVALLLLLGLLALGSGAQERRLVFLRPVPFGYVAEITPAFDYTTCLSRAYRIQGVDKSVLQAVATADGLPVRLYGTFVDDRVTVPGVKVGQPPPVLPIPGGTQVWRGRVHARVLSVEPARVRVDTGLEADLRFDNPGEREQWASWATRGEFTLDCTALNTTLVDLTFSPWSPPRQTGSYRLLLQLSEGFLTRVARAYLAAHPALFRWNDFVVRELGLTLLDCPPGEARLYGRLDGSVLGLKLVEAEWEARTRPEFQGTRLVTPLVANSLVLRVTRPFFVGVPPTWTEGLRALLGTALKDGLVLPVPELYRPDLLASGVLEESQLASFRLFTVPTGDRRSALLVAAAPLGPGPHELLASRLTAGAEYALALSPDAVNAALARTIPRLLPLRKAIPPELQLNSQVFVFRLKLKEAEVAQLDLGFAGGRWQVRNAVINIHWTLGPLSGVEPGARVVGSASVTGEGSPLRLRLDPEVTTLEFLSSHITEQSPPEQAALREQLVRAMKGTTIDLPLPSRLPVPDLSAALELTGVGSQGEDLVLQGRLVP